MRKTLLLSALTLAASAWAFTPESGKAYAVKLDAGKGYYLNFENFNSDGEPTLSDQPDEIYFTPKTDDADGIRYYIHNMPNLTDEGCKVLTRSDDGNKARWRPLVNATTYKPDQHYWVLVDGEGDNADKTEILNPLWYEDSTPGWPGASVSNKHNGIGPADPNAPNYGENLQANRPNEARATNLTCYWSIIDFDDASEIVVSVDLSELDGRSVLLKGHDTNLYLVASTQWNMQCWELDSPNIRGSWTIHVTDRNELTFVNDVTGYNMWERGCSNGNTKTTYYAYDFTLEEDGYVLQKSDTEKLHAVKDDVLWTSDDEEARWDIIEVTDEIRNEWLAQAKVNYVAGAEVAENPEPGQYISTDANYATKAEKIANLPAAFNYAQVADLIANPISAAPVLFDINSIQGPALVRIKNSEAAKADRNMSDYWIATSNVAHGTSQWSTLVGHKDDETSILLLENVNGKTNLTSYDGRHAYNNGNHMTWNDADNSSDPASLTFQSAYSGEVGAYSISLNNYGFGCENGNNNALIVGNTSTTANKPHLAFNIEYVKELTINVDGEKIWRAPVAVSLKGDVDATQLAIYALSINDARTEITTTAVEDQSVVYAAGTAFVMKGNGTANFTVHNNYNGETAGSSVGILGHHSIKNHNVAENMVAMTLTSAMTPTEAEIMLMSEDSTADPNTLHITALEDETSVRLPAHNVLLEVDRATTLTTDPKTGEKKNTLVLTLGDTTTTGITEISHNAAAGNAIYDLMGRKLSKPVKGLNIINGQKRIIK